MQHKLPLLRCNRSQSVDTLWASRKQLRQRAAQAQQYISADRNLTPLPCKLSFYRNVGEFLSENLKLLDTAVVDWCLLKRIDTLNIDIETKVEEQVPKGVGRSDM